MSVGTKSRRGLLAAGLAMLAVRPLSAAVSPARSVDLRYSVDMTGLKIADLELAITPGAAGTTQSRFVMRSQGLVSLFSDAWSRLTATSRTDADGGAQPQQFQAYHHKSDRVREIAISYDGKGAISRLDVKSQGKSRPSEVPANLRAGTIDPLTAFLEIRAWLPLASAARAKDSIRLAIFDGRKRFDLEARYVGRASAGGRDAYELSIVLRGLSGFDPEDKLFMPNADGSGSLRALISADDQLVPLSITSTGGGVGPTVRLTTDCATANCKRLVP